MPLVTIIFISSLQEVPLNLVEVFSSFWLLEPIYGRIQGIPQSLTRFGAAVAGAHRLIGLLAEADIEESIRAAPSDAPVQRQKPNYITLRNLSVNFNGTKALDSISLELRLDQRTAIVGSVGGGKSTLLEVLVGELPPTSGEILIGFPSGPYPLWRADIYHQWLSAVAYSPQQPFLSNTSLRDNLDISGYHSPEEVELAIAASQLNDDLILFPHGLNEEIGESGINLSGGQKQRVSLARAFISHRSVMILDDPLSAVDPKTENLLMDAILANGKGVILVSHRLAELERCDRVLVLEEGLIVEDGNPRALAVDPESRFFSFLKAVEGHGG
jgi:ABC-type multidrug transport system fused ATPase/permease subunit